MTPEGWARVKEIFNAALDQSPEKREKFLSEACGGDESLRREVNRLLAEHDQAGEFLNTQYGRRESCHIPQPNRT